MVQCDDNTAASYLACVERRTGMNDMSHGRCYIPEVRNAHVMCRISRRKDIQRKRAQYPLPVPISIARAPLPSFD